VLSATTPIVLLQHGGLGNLSGKTGLAMLRYRPGPIVAVVDPMVDPSQPTGSLEAITGIRRAVPVVSNLQAALPFGPEAAVVGLAPSGGRLPAELRADLEAALASGLNLASGLHTRLGSDPQLAALLRPGQWIWDLRQEPAGLTVAAGRAAALPGERFLAVGTDMAVGKMSACLELTAAARRKGIDARFVGTGQAGILISGAGVPLDAVRVDFAAGAVEAAVLAAAGDADEDTLLFVEGQGSLCHPGSSASLPLIRGSQPTGFLLVHRAGQTALTNHPGLALPPLIQLIDTIEQLAALGRTGAAPAPRVRAVALNTARLADGEAEAACGAISLETGLTCADPVRSLAAADRLLEALRADEGIRTPGWRHHKPLP
jgi:uncharacterized NAD-dependent epimerase/dehydratase family protein